MLPKPKKSLGQNFLSDRTILRKMVDTCHFSCEDIILEIGPGRGALTGFLAEEAKEVYAVELDRQLFEQLKAKFAGQTNVKIIHADILQYDLSRLGANGSRKIKVIGNIPYYITTPIIEHLFAFKDRIDTVYLTVQKEFGQRIAANPGSKVFGSFSLFVQYHSVPQMHFVIKAGSFHPAPKVDSCFLSLAMRTRPAVEVKDDAQLFKIIRTAFGQRRKTLRNSLKGVVPEEQLNVFFAATGLKPTVRPEQLSLEQFAKIGDTS